MFSPMRMGGMFLGVGRGARIGHTSHAKECNQRHTVVCRKVGFGMRCFGLALIGQDEVINMRQVDRDMDMVSRRRVYS